jgi:hypothetical protein
MASRRLFSRLAAYDQLRNLTHISFTYTLHARLYGDRNNPVYNGCALTTPSYASFKSPLATATLKPSALRWCKLLSPGLLLQVVKTVYLLASSGCGPTLVWGGRAATRSCLVCHLTNDFLPGSLMHLVQLSLCCMIRVRIKVCHLSHPIRLGAHSTSRLHRL